MVSEYISDFASLFVYAGEEEMLALAEGAMRFINDEETVKTYGVLQ